jgi:hypothetical protein
MKFTPDPDKRQAHEYWLTWVITGIVGLELIFAVLGFWEGKDQVRDLGALNGSLRASIKQTQSMADILNSQLAILQKQEQERLTALERKPKLVLSAGGADLTNHAQKPKPCLPIPGRGDIAQCSILIENHGEVPFTNGRLRIWSDSSDAHFNGANIEAVQLLSIGLTGDGLELLLPPILKGEAPRFINVEVVLFRKHPVRLSLQIVGDGIETTNLTPMEALPVEPVPSN